MVTKYGQVEVNKTHGFYSSLKGVKLSPYFKDLVLFTGQMECYELASELVEKFTLIKVSDTSIHRLVDQYEEESEELLEERDKIKSKDDSVIYVQMDGSMILTREEKWKEVKLGRVYSSEAHVEISGDRGWIRDSEYCAHLGGHEIFKEKMSKIVDEYDHKSNKLVFLMDGAPWMKKWVEEEYPHAIQILDYYHVLEYLGKLGNEIIIDSGMRKAWYDRVKKEVLEDKAKEVLEEIKKMKPTGKKGEEIKEKVITYFDANIFRMNYKTYQNQGLNIGSGAIESAHRTVIQKRLKLSGQRWSKSGAQRILNLRVLNMSGYWHRLVDYLRAA